MANGTELLITPFCRTSAFPDIAPMATIATTWVSLQLCTVLLVVPSHTWPLPCVAPKPDPEIVTCVPGTPLVGEMLEIAAVLTLNGTVFDDRPFCCT